MAASAFNYGGWFGSSSGTGGSPIAAITTVVTLCASLMAPAGTAAKSDDAILLQTQDPDSSFTRGLIPVAQSELGAPSSVELLERVLVVFTPSVSGLAKVFGVSRQTLYNWKNGERLSAENEEKLRSMGGAADLFSRAKITVTGSILKRKVLDNKTLFDIACGNGPVLSAAEILVSRLINERNQQNIITSRFANRQPVSISADSDLIAINDRS